MNRRNFLQCAAVLTSGTLASPLALSLSAEQQQFIQGKEFLISPVSAFNAQQRQLVAAMSDTIIPRTDTPGAIDAGVPKFIEIMVGHWLNNDERKLFFKGLKEAEKLAIAETGKPFTALPKQHQESFLVSLEEKASQSSWYAQGNIRRAFISDAPFICMLKELTVWGFFASEVGAKQVLRYNPMPMYFDGDYPLKEGESAWAASRF